MNTTDIICEYLIEIGFKDASPNRFSVSGYELLERPIEHPPYTMDLESWRKIFLRENSISVDPSGNWQDNCIRVFSANNVWYIRCDGRRVTISWSKSVSSTEALSCSADVDLAKPNALLELKDILN